LDPWARSEGLIASVNLDLITRPGIACASKGETLKVDNATSKIYSVALTESIVAESVVAC